MPLTHDIGVRIPYPLQNESRSERAAFFVFACLVAEGGGCVALWWRCRAVREQWNSPKTRLVVIFQDQSENRISRKTRLVVINRQKILA